MKTLYASVSFNISESKRFSKHSIYYLTLLVLLGFSSFCYGQDAELNVKTESTICEGESTTLQVIIGASVGPYTVVYSDGSGNYTVSNYSSNADPESPGYGGDPISVSPTTTTNYSLVSVHDTYNNSLPVSTATAVVTVNPLVTNLVVTVNSGNPVCYNSSFEISATGTNLSSAELWNAANTTKIADLPHSLSITADTDYTVRANSPGDCQITQSLSVELEDIAPTISCPADVIINPTSNCQISLSDYTGSVTVSDNCTSEGTITLSQSPLAGSVISGDGTVQEVTITATDEAGNQNSCSFNVTIDDTEDPAISGSATSETVSSNNGSCGYVVSSGEYDPTTVTDNCSIQKVTYSINGGGEVGTDESTSLDGVILSGGDNNIVWTAYDINGNTNTWSFTITIEDDTAPVFDNCPTDRELETNIGDCDAVLPNYVSLLSVYATDNCTDAGSISFTQLPAAGSVLNGGHNSTQLVTITADDGNGNTTDCNFTVTVKDETNPTIVNLPSDIDVENDTDECGAIVSWTEPTSADNCSGHSILQTAGLSSGSLFPVGSTTITYEATDGAGNTHSESFTVTVTDTQDPVISCPENILTGADAGQDYAVVTFTTPIGTDNCSGSTTEQTSGLASGEQFPIGVTTNTFKVTDTA